MNHSALTPVFAGLRWSLHSLLIALIAVIFVRSVLTDAPDSAQIHALASSLLAVYLGGSLLAHLRPDGIRSSRWIPWLWVWTLSVLWLCLMWLTPDAAFIAFPLFFLYLQLLPSRIAFGAVVVSTALSIVAISLHSGFTVGGVIGPMIGAGVAVAIGFGYRSLSREAEDRQQLITELVETRGELATAERAAGMLAERERLAGEIHDTVAQGLSSIQILLHAAERLDGNRPGLEQLQLARQTAAESLVDTRRIIRELTPPALDDRTLPGALARLADSTRDTLRASGTPATVNFQLEGDPAPLPMNVNATLLRIAQGAIANVVQHARAGRADITLTYQSDSVSLDIVDDGIGFDPDALPIDNADDSFGLRAIRQRVASLGGVLSVESDPGEGTALAATIPVREAAPVDASRPGARA